MADSIEDKLLNTSVAEKHNYCDYSLNDSLKSETVTNGEPLEDGDQKGFKHLEDFEDPTPNHCDEGKGDYGSSLNQNLPTTWGISKRDPGLYYEDSDDSSEEGEDLNTKESSLYTRIMDAIGSVGNSIKNSFADVFTSGSDRMLRNRASNSENNSVQDDSDLQASVFNSYIDESLVEYRCPLHRIPQDEIHPMDLVSQWVVQTSSTVVRECDSSTSIVKPLQISSCDNFQVLNMDMLQYCGRRKFADLKVCVGKSVYKVDSCFLQAQSTKFRQLLFWGKSGVHRNHSKDNYIPCIKLADLSSLEFEALLIYMYTGGYLVPSAVSNDGINEPTSRFLHLLKLYGIPYVSKSSEN